MALALPNRSRGGAFYWQPERRTHTTASTTWPAGIGGRSAPGLRTYLLMDAPRQAHRPQPLRRRVQAAALMVAVAAGVFLLLAPPSYSTPSSSRLLLAPMIHGVELCTLPSGGPAPAGEQELTKYCRESSISAAGIIESTLSALGPAMSANDRFELGYTMPIALLKLLVAGDSGWQVDRLAVERLAKTVKETDRPVILHLFSTHFGIHAPIEDVLATDPANLSVSARGRMPKDKYYSIDIYPWSLASTDNGITWYRQTAIRQVIDAMCRLGADDRRKIRAITLLGELHHFHADFEHGMGIGGPYVVSDYSGTSIEGFRAFLAKRYGDIAALNEAIGEDYGSFAEVEPPSKDGRRTPLRRPAEHIDSSAHGQLALTGWAFDAVGGRNRPVWVRIYRNGELIARVPARYGRQDVLQAKPLMGTADVGWRYDMDFTTLSPGVHRLDFLAERSGGTLGSLGSRQVKIVDRDWSARTVSRTSSLPDAADTAGLEGSIDYPPDGGSVYFNPLVPLWHAFRNAQVVAYLGHFEQQLRASCLGGVALYTHQIVPFANPSWDSTKFAVDQSLLHPGGLRLGVSLYGEASYGHSFFDWLATSGHRSYGVTEFHPLKAMSPQEVGDMLERHRRHGAAFISFFLDARPTSVRDAARANMFAFDAGNPRFGSDRLYSAVRTILNE